MDQEKEQFKLRVGLKSGNEEVDEYLKELHDYLLNWEATSIKDMILTLDKTAKIIAEDLRMLNSGQAFTPAYTVERGDTKVHFEEECKLKILNDSKDSKVYDRVMTLVGKVKDFKIVCDMAENIRPEIVDEKKAIKPKLKIEANESAYESILKQRAK